MSNFTKGPWLQAGTTVYALEQHGYYRGKPDYRNRFDAQVQGAFCPEEEREATARLIASAPELLAALKALFGADMEYCMMSDGKQDQIDAIEAARAAIAKATGESA